MPELEDYPTCPVCGHIELDAADIDFGPGLDGDAETDCASCGASLFVSRQVTVMYSTALLRSSNPRIPPALIAAAAEASEQFGDDECEAFAAELRASRSGGAM